MTAAFSNPAQTWDEKFASADYIFGTEPNTWLAAHEAFLKPGGKALAVADGEGRNSVWLAKQGMLVDAFDIASVGVGKARKLAELHQVSVNYQVSCCEDWSWEAGQYDVVAAIFIQFADPESRSTLFANMIATLKPGGVLLLQGYTPKQLEFKTGGPPELSHLYTEDLLRENFAALEIIKLDSYETELHEGSKHKGPSALISMVARKRAD